MNLGLKLTRSETEGKVRFLSGGAWEGRGGGGGAGVVTERVFLAVLLIRGFDGVHFPVSTS